MKIGSRVGLSACAPAFADDGPRKTAVLDTGKDGLHLVILAPSDMNGPYDFARNKGPNVFGVGSDFTTGEVMFNEAIGDSGVVVYQAMIVKRSPYSRENNRLRQNT